MGRVASLTITGWPDDAKHLCGPQRTTSGVNRSTSYRSTLRGCGQGHIRHSPGLVYAPVVLPIRTFRGDSEISEFYDASYIARTAYNLKAGDFNSDIENRRVAKGVQGSIRILGQVSSYSF